MRPGRLEEFVGQSHLLGEGSGLRTAIEQGRPHSMVLYGPPGTGKTTLARLLASNSDAAFEELSAVQAGRAEVRAVIERAAHRRTLGTPTVLFLDEIHRFNKAQQDALLPAVEDGLVTLIGATTENPAFEVNGALLSRLRVYALQELSAEEVASVLRRAVADAQIEVDENAIEFLAARSAGDARTALNALELALDTAHELGEKRIDIERAQDALQRRAVLYDKEGDRHYDYISAWIKATRGSDPDASLAPDRAGAARRGARCDGIFPPVSNVATMSASDLLLAYKQQPMIEKRFSQLKTDFVVAPVFLKEVSRIQALLCVYFFALLLECCWSANYDGRWSGKGSRACRCIPKVGRADGRRLDG